MATHDKGKKKVVLFQPKINTQEKALNNAYDLDLISDYPDVPETEQPKVEQPEAGRAGVEHVVSVWTEGAIGPEVVNLPFEPKREEPPHISYIDQFAACKKRLATIEAELEIANKKVDELNVSNSQLAMHLKAALEAQDRLMEANSTKSAGMVKVAVTSRSV